ncbi:hypothetical protein D3C72_2232110 [compost metagenome]
MEALPCVLLDVPDHTSVFTRNGELLLAAPDAGRAVQAQQQRIHRVSDHAVEDVPQLR